LTAVAGVSHTTSLLLRAATAQQQLGFPSLSSPAP
jgi:hypothetical protein